MVGKAAGEIRQAMPPTLSSTLMAAEAQSELFRLAQRFRDQIVVTALAEQRAEHELRRFRIANGLTREARYRESGLLQIGLIAVAVLFEAGLNGVLFQKTNDLGLAGGAAQALILALVNVSAGLMLGLVGWRLAGHRQLGPRLLGFAVTLALSAFGLFWNLYVAHFRAALEARLALPRKASALQYAPLDALDRMAAGLFNLGGDDSLALLAIGGLIFIFATFEGRSGLADPYWGYKARDQALSDGRAAHAAMKDRYRRALGRAIEAREARIDAALRADLKRLADMKSTERAANLAVHRLGEKARALALDADGPAEAGFPTFEPVQAALASAEAIMIANRNAATEAKAAGAELLRAAENGLEPLIAAAEAEAGLKLRAEWQGAGPPIDAADGLEPPRSGSSSADPGQGRDPDRGWGDA